MIGDQWGSQGFTIYEKSQRGPRGGRGLSGSRSGQRFGVLVRIRIHHRITRTSLVYGLFKVGIKNEESSRSLRAQISKKRQVTSAELEKYLVVNHNGHRANEKINIEVLQHRPPINDADFS